MNDNDQPTLDEAALQRLLGTTPEPTLSDAQRERLRARLQLAPDRREQHEAAVDAATHAGPPLTVVDVASTRPEGGGRLGRRRPGRNVLAWAAVVIVVVGLGVALPSLRDESNTDLLAGERGMSQLDDGAVAFCRDHAAVFAESIVIWDGVENWGFLTDRRLPEPDLVAVALETLTALGSLVSNSDVEAVSAALLSLQSDSDVGQDANPPFAWTAAERSARVEAVVEAVEVVGAVIADREWGELEGCGPAG